MIYTKTKLKDGAVVCGPVTAKSTYTRCAVCGKEIQIDLRELKLGFKVYILDAASDIDKIVKEVMPDEVHTT